MAHIRNKLSLIKQRPCVLQMRNSWGNLGNTCGQLRNHNPSESSLGAHILLVLSCRGSYVGTALAIRVFVFIFFSHIYLLQAKKWWPFENVHSVVFSDSMSIFTHTKKKKKQKKTIFKIIIKSKNI